MTDHELDKLLAEVAGVEVSEETTLNGVTCWAIYNGDELEDVWTPRTDANDMELVKAGLRKKGYGYHVVYDLYRKVHDVKLWLADRQWPARNHESELMAFALAIQAMTSHGTGGEDGN